jgi:hypothetical protein
MLPLLWSTSYPDDLMTGLVLLYTQKVEQKRVSDILRDS